MATTTHSMNTSTDAPLNCPQESTSIVIHLHEPFLKFDPTSDLSFEDQSKIYCSLVALVKAKCPLDDALQERAVRFLKSLRPEWGEDLAAKLITELVPSTAGSPSGFIDSIITLLSSPHSILRAAALSFVRQATVVSSTEIRCLLMESDLVSKVLTSVHLHTPPIAGTETIFNNLIRIV